jgi:deoxyribonuclease I
VKRVLLSILILIISPHFAFPHPGGLDSSGGHFHSTTHQYHCHRDTCVPIPPDATTQPTNIPKNTRPTLGPSRYGTSTSKAMMKIFKADNKTFYCGCTFNQDKTINFEGCYVPINKWANKIKVEQEHIVPASFFGNYRTCWKKPEECKLPNGKFKKNRKCCQDTDLEFKKAEADLHNFKPAIGQLNAWRNNKPYGVIEGDDLIGGCDLEIDDDLDLAEPRDSIKGDIARVFLYMNDAWDMPLDDTQRNMYLEWSNADPVSGEEKDINRKVCEAQGNSNNFVEVLVFDPETNKCEPIN